MFQSATLKLTGWYLLILMLTSILFSVSIFELTTHELSARLERFEQSVQIAPGFNLQPIQDMRATETSTARANIIGGLVTANILILIIGGGVSFLLARRTLRPIKDAHEAQSRFTSDASHELRTPLAAMRTEIEVALRDKKATKKDLDEVLKSNLEEVDKLTSLSQMLLKLSRLDHDTLETKDVNIKSITETVIKRHKVIPGRILLKASKYATTTGNETALTELVSILVDNALKYSPKTSLILINVFQRDKKICFEIINSGDGIAEAKLPFIFDRFYRADNSRTSRNGYGLGLSLAKKIVELSHGDLTVTSTLGQTTIFTVLLPVPLTNSAK
jgi:two-component system sensor histidine kinase CiaH